MHKEKEGRKASSDTEWPAHEKLLAVLRGHGTEARDCEAEHPEWRRRAPNEPLSHTGLVNPTNLVKLTGLDPTAIATSFDLVIFADRGNGPEEIGTATTIEEAVATMADVLFDGGVPEYEPDYGPDGSFAGESSIEQALAYELGESQNIGRIVPDSNGPSEGLAYLGSVLEDDPTLRLVVAWEAQAPAQDFAIGIFAR